MATEGALAEVGRDFREKCAADVDCTRVVSAVLRRFRSTRVLAAVPNREVNEAHLVCNIRFRDFSGVFGRAKAYLSVWGRFWAFVGFGPF